jgi:ribosomal-protein-alanine N-acetyltransferase
MTGGAAPAHLAVTVSPMRRRHLPEVLGIEAQVYPKPWSRKLFEDELERSGRVYVVARIGPTLVGYAGLLMIADDGHVATVAVDPRWQRHGIAKRLLLELVEGAMLLGANQLTLEVRMGNTGAQDLYRRFGFVPAGARKAYYADNNEDALVMWAHDVATPEYAARLAEIGASLDGPSRRVGFDEPAALAAIVGEPGDLELDRTLAPERIDAR